MRLAEEAELKLKSMKKEIEKEARFGRKAMPKTFIAPVKKDKKID